MVGSILAKRKTGWPCSIVWKRDVRMVIHPDAKVRPAAGDEQEPDSNVYVLAYTGMVCAIVPRGINVQEPDRLYGYTGFLKSFVAKRCKQNYGVFMVILRGVYDIITAQTILYMKQEFRQIRLICVEPYADYNLTLKPAIRERYLQIIKAADEVHRYEKDNEIGDAEQYALAHADALLFIQSEDISEVWQKLLDGIWSDLRKSDGFMYNLTRLWIVNMEWIIREKCNDAATDGCLY